MPPLVIFNKRSFISDKGRYNSLTKVFTLDEGVVVEDGYLEDKISEIDRKFYFSAQILDLDYYSAVFGKE